MSTLTPGSLQKLLHQLNPNPNPNSLSPLRPTLLQIISIVPALAGKDLYSSQGFYLKVSDSSHSTFVSLSEQDNDLISSDKIQLGQFVYIDRLELASPVPVITGLKPIPGRHPCIGTPQDLVNVNNNNINNNSSNNNNINNNNDNDRLKKLNKIIPKIETMESRRASLSRSSSSLSKQSFSSLDDKREINIINNNINNVNNNVSNNNNKSKSVSRSIPNSPTSCHSMPLSFDKLPNKNKDKGKASESNKATGSRMGLLERAASVLKATGKRNPGNSNSGILKSGISALGNISGQKNLRKSWEGNPETSSKVKSRDSFSISNSNYNNNVNKVNKSEIKMEIRSSSVPRRKPTIEEKPPPKEETKSQNPTKKSNSNSNSNLNSNSNPEGSEKLNRVRTPIGKKTNEAPTSLSLNNLTKIPINSRKLTNNNNIASWGTLPSPLAKLGKEVMGYRDAAENAAIEAIQEASIAETLLRCLSAYAELKSSAKEDSPQEYISQFLSLHSLLTRASLISDSLSKSPLDQSQLATSSSPSQSSSDQSQSATSSETLNNHRQMATKWVNAALSTDLSAFSLYGPRIAPPGGGESLPEVKVVVSGESPAKSGGASKARNNPSPVTKRIREPPPVPVQEVREWRRGREGMSEASEMAKGLKSETTTWFLGFVEKFLDADVAQSSPWDRDRVAGMLSQLKRVNDWLDQVGKKRDEDEEEREDEEEDGFGFEGVPKETVERLRKKIYEYLLTHVESAAAALGGAAGNQTAPPSATGRRN